MLFEKQYYLIYLILAIPLIIILIKNYFLKNKYFNKASAEINNIISANISVRANLFKNVLLLIALLLLIIASSGPMYGKKPRQIQRQGSDLVMAIDVSSSMNAEDVSPSRIEKTKYVIKKIINNLNGDRVSIIIFAGSSHIYLPLTTDYEAAIVFLNSINTNIIPSQGTSLSAAMRTCLNSFSQKEDNYKTMILFTDGEDHEGTSLKLAEEIKSAGMSIYTVGVGSLEGGLIPLYDKNTRTHLNYKKDSNGNIITSIVNENILKEIANIGNGKFIRLSNQEGSYKNILNNIDEMKKREINTFEYLEYDKKYKVFSISSLVFLVAGIMLPTRKKINKWL